MSVGETFGNYLWREIPQAGHAGQGGYTGWVSWSSGQISQTGQPGQTGQTGQTSQRGLTRWTDLFFKLDFPGSLCRAAFAILAMFRLWVD